jgi:hypothetical protein
VVPREFRGHYTNWRKFRGHYTNWDMLRFHCEESDLNFNARQAPPLRKLFEFRGFGAFALNTNPSLAIFFLQILQIVDQFPIHFIQFVGKKFQRMKFDRIDR